jgi:hypothetical protein
MAIRLTDAALDGPIRWAAIPGASAVIVVIAPVVVGIADADVDTGRVDVEALRLYRSSRSNCRRADKAQRKIALIGDEKWLIVFVR